MRAEEFPGSDVAVPRTAFGEPDGNIHGNEVAVGEFGEQFAEAAGNYRAAGIGAEFLLDGNPAGLAAVHSCHAWHVSSCLALGES